MRHLLFQPVSLSLSEQGVETSMHFDKHFLCVKIWMFYLDKFNLPDETFSRHASFYSEYAYEELKIVWNYGTVILLYTFNDGYNPLVFKYPRMFAQSCCKLGRKASPRKEDWSKDWTCFEGIKKVIYHKGTTYAIICKEQ